MKMHTWEETNYEEKLQKIRDKVGPDYVFKRWHASIHGPWYDDSNPSGRGDTEEEAKRNAMEALEEMYQMIGEFLKENGVVV